MTDLFIKPSKLSGTLSIPSSKSHTLRALVLAMLANGTSRIQNPLSSPDTDAMLNAIEQFGAKIARKENLLEITGGFSPSAAEIDAGNSGQVLRFIAAIASLLPSTTTITGDDSICCRRPIKPLLKALSQGGANAKSIRENDFAPVLIQGPLNPGTFHISGEDSQPVSALLIATSFLKGESKIFVNHPGETPWIDLTLHWLEKLGAEIFHENYRHYIVQGGLHYPGFTTTIPADFSSAAFPIAAALVTKSSLKLEGLDPADVQGDRIIIDILQKMGANIAWKKNTLLIEPTQELYGYKIDINTCIDALPILAVIGCFATGTTTLYNGSIARQKESDRIRSICQELKKMGAKIEEKPDGLVIEQSPLQGTDLTSHHDHRIALSLSVAALASEGNSRIQNAECIAKTYQNFIADFQTLGASIELDLVRV